MAQWTQAAGFTDIGIEKSVAKSASAGKKIHINLRNLRLVSLRALCGEKIREIGEICG